MIPAERLPAYIPTASKYGLTTSLTLPVESGIPVRFRSAAFAHPQKNAGEVWRVHTIGGNPAYLVTVQSLPRDHAPLAAGTLTVPTAGNTAPVSCFRSDTDFLIDGSDSECTDFYFTWNSPVAGVIVLTRVWPQNVT